MWSRYIGITWRCDECDQCNEPIQPHIRELLSKHLSGYVRCQGSYELDTYDEIEVRNVRSEYIRTIKVPKECQPNHTRFIEVRDYRRFG